ncbi:MAG TPA: ABC transporter substrate-binding protein [Candidatus Binatia bacterium]|nr:ABC transporter substrate-binding protein [Candidatus Binatia bacterium]
MRSNRNGINRRDFLKQTTLAGLGLVANASWPRVGYPASAERLTILTSVSLSSLDPYAFSSSPEYGIWSHMAESLVDVDYVKMEYVGALAESWEFQGKKWVFNLRKGVRFHDGSPFTAKDVIYSYQRILDHKKSPQRYALTDITEMNAADDHTLILTTKTPTAVMLDRLTNRNILGKAAADKYGSDVLQHPTGTGPYKFVSYQRDGQLVLTRNDDYWGGKAAIKEIVTRKVSEDAARVSGLLAGQGDVINNVPVEEISRIESNPKTRIERAQGQRMYFLALNPVFKPFDNKLVRQAFNYAIDPSVIIKHIYEGNGYVMDGPVASNVIGADPKIKRYPLDPKKAKELLAEAGYPNGVDVKLYLAPARYPKAREVCQVIADQLQKAGVRTELVAQEWAIFWGQEGVNGGKLPFYYVGRPAVDADTVYEQYFRSGVTKRIQYKNSEFDKLIDEEQITGDMKKRVEILRQAGRVLMDDAPFVPLYTLAEIYGVAQNVIWKAKPGERVLAYEMKIRS